MRGGKSRWTKGFARNKTRRGKTGTHSTTKTIVVDSEDVIFAARGKCEGTWPNTVEREATRDGTLETFEDGRWQRCVHRHNTLRSGSDIPVTMLLQ